MTHKEPTRSRMVANIFGAFGYMSLIVQWAWTLLILAYPLLASGTISFLSPETPTVTPEPADFGIATPVVTIVAVATTILVMLMTIILVAKLPKTIGRQGARTTHAAAHKLAPLAAGHKPLTKKRRRTLSYRIVLVLKVIAITLPVALLAFAAPIAALTLEMIWAVGLFCATCSVIYFGIQQVIALTRGVKRDAIW